MGKKDTDDKRAMNRFKKGHYYHFNTGIHDGCEWWFKLNDIKTDGKSNGYAQFFFNCEIRIIMLPNNEYILNKDIIINFDQTSCDNIKEITKKEFNKIALLAVI